MFITLDHFRIVIVGAREGYVVFGAQLPSRTHSFQCDLVAAKEVSGGNDGGGYSEGVWCSGHDSQVDLPLKIFS